MFITAVIHFTFHEPALCRLYNYRLLQHVNVSTFSGSEEYSTREPMSHDRKTGDRSLTNVGQTKRYQNSGFGIDGSATYSK
jgi:hypothetical protein